MRVSSEELYLHALLRVFVSDESLLTLFTQYNKLKSSIVKYQFSDIGSRNQSSIKHINGAYSSKHVHLRGIF